MAVAIPSALSDTLARAARRVRVLLALRHGATGLFAGGLGSLLLVAVLRSPWGESWPSEWLAAPPAAGLLLGTLWGATRAVPPLDVARLTEQRLDLKERLSTALALAPAGERDPLVARQVRDAEAHAAGGLDLRVAFPLGLPRRVWAGVGACLGAALLWFLPTFSFLQSPQERAERAAVRREGERLVRVAKVLERDAGAKKLAETGKAAGKLAALGNEMKQGQLSRQKALMKAAKLTEQMKQSQQALAAQAGAGAPKSLPEAGKELQKTLQAAAAEKPKAPGKSTAAALQAPSGDGEKPAHDAKPAAAAAAATRDAMKGAQKALAGADVPSLAEQLSKLAQQAQAGQPGDKADREQLARQLAALAKALEGTRLEKASEPLQQAAEALKRNDLGEASRALQEAARRTSEAARREEDLQAMRQMASALQNGEREGGEPGAEGDAPSDAGEGEGENDAFGKNGKPKKSHAHSAACTAPGGT
jgi:hypothetical protein